LEVDVQRETPQANGAKPAEAVELSEEEIIREIDQEARERLHMSFDQFVDEYRAGTLPDTLAVNELVIMLRLVDPSRIPA
jgi:hypothetical protein